MSRFEKLFSVYHCFFRHHVCLSNLKHAPSRELPLTARKTVFSHLNVKDAVPEGLRTRVVYKFSCARRIVMLVMLVKPADVSPHEFAGTYFPTGLRMVLDICRVQSLVEHPAHRTASRSWTLQLLST